MKDCNSLVIYYISMKILYIVPDFFPNVSWYWNATTNLINKVIETTEDYRFVYTKKALWPDQEINMKDKGIVIRSCFLNQNILDPIRQFVNAFKVLYLIYTKKIDLIFFETAEYGILGYLISLFYRKNIVVRIHWTQETEMFFFKKSLYTLIYWFFAKLFLKRTDNVISTCNYYVDFLKDHLYKNPLKIAKRTFFILPNFSKESSKKEKKQNNNFKNILLKYNIDINEEKLFISLWRLNKDWLLQKWFEDLIYSMYLVKDKIKNSKILLIGNWEKYWYIMNLIQSLRLDQIIVLIPSIENSDLQIIMQNSITVLLSRFEWFSMFALEAISNWSIWLFTNTGWHTDLIKDQFNWFIVNSKDFNEISNKIVHIDSLSKDNLANLRKNSLEYYKEHFTNDILIEKLYKIIWFLSKQY